ncbi:MAG: hypothetical protein IJZ37_03130 [Clostridia bacterium]|nr:hypothetical protein [Clostridia bacterium]
MLAGYFKPVFESILHSGARGYSKVYAEERLPFEPVKLDYRGFESRRAPKAYRQWIGLSFGTQKMTHTNLCARTLRSGIRYHLAKGEALRRISRSNARACLA